MLNKLINLFGKGDEDETHLPENESYNFRLMVDNLEVGTLRCESGFWFFKYSDEFKKHLQEYKPLTEFPDLEKEYQDDFLWPFFKIRIPGLKQPAIQEIIKREKIDQMNEAALLKRFGERTIANPYQLLAG
ncbi:MAG: HipA N-terminal domain-containing protein [Bacteroidia bacterium]|jgi:HipA-like protein|nr:HipA N-terminal domain-containing protein [Bacteroidia bacterium]